MEILPRLGVNIDHVATLRNARGENYPSPLRAAVDCEKFGADGITAHLREDRRHIMDQDIFEKPYNDTACSIVSETNDNDHEVFMTEKIWKPIIAQQFFIVHGNYLYLQKLRELGFKTFNNYFEEAYDIDKDPDVRINTIVDVCDRLRDAPWQDIYLQSKALRQYNFDHFFNKENLSVEINKTLISFLEFADSGQISS